MAFLGQKFNPNQVEPSQSREPIPAGEYVMMIEKSEVQDTAKRDGKYLKFEFTVVEGQYKGRKIWTNLNLWNKNQVSVEMAWRTLGDICRACGYYRDLEDTSAINKIPFKAKVGIKKGEGSYKDQNEISEYIAVKPGTAVAPQPVANQVSHPEVASAEDVPPWLQNAE